MFRQLEINPLNKDAFAPFGDVIEIENAERLMINDGTAERYNDLADIDVASDGGRPTSPRRTRSMRAETEPRGTRSAWTNAARRG